MCFAARLSCTPLRWSSSTRTLRGNCSTTTSTSATAASGARPSTAPTRARRCACVGGGDAAFIGGGWDGDVAKRTVPWRADPNNTRWRAPSGGTFSPSSSSFSTRCSSCCARRTRKSPSFTSTTTRPCSPSGGAAPAGFRAATRPLVRGRGRPCLFFLDFPGWTGSHGWGLPGFSFPRAPGPPINSIVHVLMYAYYGMCAMGERQRQMMNIVKKYMTIIQLVRVGAAGLRRLGLGRPNGAHLFFSKDAIPWRVFQHDGGNLLRPCGRVQLSRVDGLGTFSRLRGVLSALGQAIANQGRFPLPFVRSRCGSTASA